MKNKFKIPLICEHRDYDEHQNIQYKQEHQDSKMPSQVQEHHNQRIYHSHTLYEVCLLASQFSSLIVAVANFLKGVPYERN